MMYFAIRTLLRRDATSSTSRCCESTPRLRACWRGRFAQDHDAESLVQIIASEFALSEASCSNRPWGFGPRPPPDPPLEGRHALPGGTGLRAGERRSEEHTSELQSHSDLV